TKKLLKESYKVIVPSLYFEEIIKGKYNINKSKITVYPSAGINKNLFFPAPIYEKNIQIGGIKINNKFNFIGYIGRIEKGKGWRTFLIAISILIKKGKIQNEKVL